MTYIDGYVLPVPNANMDAYRQLAERTAEVFRRHGALRVVECWGDDVPEGKVTSFTIATQRKDDESVVFSWTEWPSKEVRDAGMKAAMAEFETMPDMVPYRMPFDGMRMFWGGFRPIVEA